MPSDARACGIFFAKLGEDRKPSLAYEQALIVYDEQQGREHFIRQVVFREAGEPFGFVVPVPERPEVAPVARDPFSELRTSFAFGSPPPSTEGPSGFGTARARLGGSGAGVALLEVQKVGSFTAFVLKASDAGALQQWLARHGLTNDAEAEAWLAHHVRLGFFFVALRYQPPARDTKAASTPGARSDEPPAKAETLRISFQTPLPYYPYFEPLRKPRGEQRLLELWVASEVAYEPVALLEREGKRRWVRPFRPGRRYENARERLLGILGQSAAPWLKPEALAIATYQDQKLSRSGFGDVLFVPNRAAPLSPERRAALSKLLGTLDPELVPEAPRPGAP